MAWTSQNHDQAYHTTSLSWTWRFVSVIILKIWITGKNNGFPFLDILGYLKNTHKNPKLEEWDKSQSGNLVGNSLVGTCLTLPNLGFLWIFFKYPKISKNGNPSFFPVSPPPLRISKFKNPSTHLDFHKIVRHRDFTLHSM